MAFRIELSPDASEQLAQLRKFDQAQIVDNMERHLMVSPQTVSRRRKQMRSNLIATWELRIGEFRVYYDLDEAKQAVLVRAIGIKHRDRVFIGGNEVDLS